MQNERQVTSALRRPARHHIAFLDQNDKARIESALNSLALHVVLATHMKLIRIVVVDTVASKQEGPEFDPQAGWLGGENEEKYCSSLF